MKSGAQGILDFSFKHRMVGKARIIEEIIEMASEKWEIQKL